MRLRLEGCTGENIGLNSDRKGFCLPLKTTLGSRVTPQSERLGDAALDRAFENNPLPSSTSRAGVELLAADESRCRRGDDDL
jgi:hypothetical protein